MSTALHRATRLLASAASVVAVTGVALAGAPAQAAPTPAPAGQVPGNRQVERLDRGLVSVRTGSGTFLSWRLLGDETAVTGFDVYRDGLLLTRQPVTSSTNYVDVGAPAGATYTVRAVAGGTGRPASGPALDFGTGYRDLPLQVPAGGTTPDGVAYTYSANDTSVGDVDGDGQYEFIVKWDPSNSKDNSQSGYTGNVYLDAYRLDGKRLWRIDLGRNIRAGAHYTQFQVYDYDGDGKAEMALKTADGTVDGTGKVIGDRSADFRNENGYVLTGPEYLTVFNGLTGAAMSTIPFFPGRGDVSAWGDGYGNRVDRFLAATAYLDGQRPSLIMARGYYTRTVVTGWDFRDGKLRNRFVFDSASPTKGAKWAGQGNHNLSVADVDADGKDEIVYGSMAIDDTGNGMWSNLTGHGDAMHVGDLDPSRPGLEEFKVVEEKGSPSSWMADARTGKILWQTPGGFDNGRGVSEDVWAGSPGAESWSFGAAGIQNTRGVVVGRRPSSVNSLVWWDGDPVRELLDGTRIDKFGPTGESRLLTAQGVAANNGSKANAALSADLFGDWREEVVWRTWDSSALRIHTTTAVTGVRLPTLMHDTQYRTGIAWQNTGYNQPAHTSFFLGDGMTKPAAPRIYYP